jgi:outer membrane receptor protein involved in Fe transport
VQWLGARPLPLEQETDPFAVLDLAASLRWRWLELGLHVSNLFDTRYRDSELYYVSTFDGSQAPPSAVPQRHFSAGAPRQLLFTLGVHTDEPGASTE